MAYKGPGQKVQKVMVQPIVSFMPIRFGVGPVTVYLTFKYRHCYLVNLAGCCFCLQASFKFHFSFVDKMRIVCHCVVTVL